MTPQPPQFIGSDEVCDSQPSVGFPLQSEKPGTQPVRRQVPGGSQMAVVPPPPVHEKPQAPQCAMSSRLCSQPFIGLLSQSPKPASQLSMTQPPASQRMRAWGALQLLPHAPQLARSRAVSVSQPSPPNALQSARPVVQLAIAQRPAEQV